MADRLADAEWKMDCLNSRMDALARVDADLPPTKFVGKWRPEQTAKAKSQSAANMLRNLMNDYIMSGGSKSEAKYKQAEKAMMSDDIEEIKKAIDRMRA